MLWPPVAQPIDLRLSANYPSLLAIDERGGGDAARE